MIVMSELVKDSTYRRFLQTKPKLPRVAKDPDRASSPPWVVYVQREHNGRWGKKEFWKYSEAFKFFSKALKKGVYDVALNNKRYPTPPPSRMVRIKGRFVTGSDGVKRPATKIVPWAMPAALLADGMPEHHWCQYCRRPTIFRWYTTHKRLGAVDPGTPRCCICGASARIALHTSDRLFRHH